MSEITAIPPNTSGPLLITAINDRLRQISLALGGSGGDSSSTSASITSGSHAMRLGRPISGFPSGSIFIESDRNNIAYQVQNNSWCYVGGVFKAAFASAPVGLVANDSGFLWNVSDYAHLLRFTGTGWEFVDAAGGYIEGRVVIPDGSGWQLCDGSVTHYLHILAGVVSEVAFTTPNWTGASPQVYLRFGAAYSGGPLAAVAPTQLLTAATGAGSAAMHTLNADGQPTHGDLIPYFRR